MSSESGRPAAISSWMWAVCEKRNGQNAKSTADVAAAQPSPVRRRANSHIVTTEAAKVNRTTTLCAVSGVAREPPGGQADHPRGEVGFGERQRVAVRMEDVRVEEVGRIGEERVRDPGHVPDRYPGIAAVGRAPEPVQARHERPGHDDGGGDRERAQDDGPPRACADGVVGDAPCRMPLIQPQKTAEAHLTAHSQSTVMPSLMTAVACVLDRRSRPGSRKARSRLVTLARRGLRCCRRRRSRSS